MSQLKGELKLKPEIAFIIFGAGIATYLTRFPIMILSGKKEIHAWLIKYMSYIAPAVLTALIVPAIFIKQGKLDLSFKNEYITAAIITAAVAYYTKNMLASVITGICTVGLLMYLMR
jgi:branched-subunit amino acid transport protein